MESIETYKAIIRTHLGDYRYTHSLCVAESAKTLAIQYGADPKKAELAGILHDILKDTPQDQQLKFMDRFAIMLTSVERASPKLWHAMAGAEYLRQELQIADPDIFLSVRYHTTGRAGMSLLERVVFTADFISADRTYPGVETMRQLAEKSLREAMLEGIAFTMQELAKKRQVIHPDTVDAFNSLLLEANGREANGPVGI